MAVIVMSAVWGVFLYNRLVDFRHEISNMERGVKLAEASNAELKNNLYKLIDAQNLEAMVDKDSLILDKNPKYVSKNFLANNQ